MKFNKGNFPVKASPQEYERWGKGFFGELRKMIRTEKKLPIYGKHLAQEILKE